MNYFESQMVWALANFLVCCALMWLCSCRIHRMENATTRRAYRFGYAMLLMAAACSAGSPVLFNEWPTWVQVFLTAVFAGVLSMGRRAWQHGVPDFARTAPAPLAHAPLHRVPGGRHAD